MAISFQYWVETGSFKAAVRCAVPPLDADLPAGVAQRVFKEHPLDKDGNPINLPAMRWNDTMQILEPCPVYAKNFRINQIQGNLQQLDLKRLRGFTDILIELAAKNGIDATGLVTVEANAGQMRAELKKLTDV